MKIQKINLNCKEDSNMCLSDAFIEDENLWNIKDNKYNKNKIIKDENNIFNFPPDKTSP